MNLRALLICLAFFLAQSQEISTKIRQPIFLLIVQMVCRGYQVYYLHYRPNSEPVEFIAV